MIVVLARASVSRGGPREREKAPANSGPARIPAAGAFTHYVLTASSRQFVELDPRDPSVVRVSTLETDDAISGALPIGFSFRFAGALHTSVKASSNGFLSFAAAPTSAPSNTLENASTTERPLIAPLWDDLSGAGGRASYQTSGVRGSRVFTFEWLDWRWDRTASAQVISFQCKLYEGTNRIEFLYRREDGTYAHSSSPVDGASIGLALAGTGRFQSIQDSSARPAFSSGTEVPRVSTMPATGQVYSLMSGGPPPIELRLPGTQPTDGSFSFISPQCLDAAVSPACVGCHGHTGQAVGNEPDREPCFGWQGSMMANAGRDPLFWAALAIAEQDFLPGSDPSTRGGAGHLCLRCHAGQGWIAGRSTPSDGSGLINGTDSNGVECHQCHLLTNPDRLSNITDATYHEVHQSPFEPYDLTTGEAYLGSGQYVLNGNHEAPGASVGARLGPLGTNDANDPKCLTIGGHAFLPSKFHREGELCGTCHDVSNPVVGDLAWNNGAQVPLAPEMASGVLGSPIGKCSNNTTQVCQSSAECSPGSCRGWCTNDLLRSCQTNMDCVSPGWCTRGKAAFNSPPYAHGILERTFSEWKASKYDELCVKDYPLTDPLPAECNEDYGSLPPDVTVMGGAVKISHDAADNISNTNHPNYADGTVRVFSCQTCHMKASTGIAADSTGDPTRYDLPRHDLTGSGYWAPDALKWQMSNGVLRFGAVSGRCTDTHSICQADSDCFFSSAKCSGYCLGNSNTPCTLDSNCTAYGGVCLGRGALYGALDAGKERAKAMLQSAAGVSGSLETSGQLRVLVINLTGHKLITGYPEGRRMWVNIIWKDAMGNPLPDTTEVGRYETLPVTDPRDGVSSLPVQSLRGLGETVVYQATPGIDEQWAGKLKDMGWPNLNLAYDRRTGAVTCQLYDLANGGCQSVSQSGIVPTFHFLLNNHLIDDDRIPPYGFRYDEARTRNALPVCPPSAFRTGCFGDPVAGGTYDYRDDLHFTPAPTAARAEVRLFYQQASWEYIQFLALQNDKEPGFLADEGINMLDAWLATGMSKPLAIAGDCVPLVAKPADRACKTGSYNVSSDTCTFSTANDGTLCDDGNACTTNDACTSGTCTGTQVSLAPPSSQPVLTMGQAVGTTVVLSWSSSGPPGYDVIQGDVPQFATPGCLAHSVQGLSFTQSGNPSVGHAFWFRVEGQLTP